MASCLLRAAAGSGESIQAEKMVVREPLSQEGHDGSREHTGDPGRELPTIKKKSQDSYKEIAVTACRVPQDSVGWAPQHPLAEQPYPSEHRRLQLQLCLLKIQFCPPEEETQCPGQVQAS